jgi:hypothetical protein
VAGEKQLGVDDEHQQRPQSKQYAAHVLRPRRAPVVCNTQRHVVQYQY